MRTASLKKVIISNPLGGWLYGKYVKYLKWRMKRALHKNGYTIIKEVHDLLQPNGYDCFADFGMLLGFVREHGFLKHDDDIDFSIRASKVDQKMVRLLLKRGYKFFRAFEFEGKLTELSFYRKGVSVDFFFYFEDDNGSYYYVYMPDKNLPINDPRWRVRRADRPRLGKVKSYEIHGVCTQIVENWDEMLTAHYGNWRVPDTKWDYTTDPRRKDIPGWGMVVDLDRAMSLLRS